MTTPVQHCLITGAYLPIIKRRVNLCSTYIQFQDNYPSEYKRFGIGRDEMMILMPQVMGVDVLSGLDKLKYVGEDDEAKGVRSVSAETMEMNAESKMLKEMDEDVNEGDDESDEEGMTTRARNEAIINVPRESNDEGMSSRAHEGMSSRAREVMNSRARDEAIINVQREGARYERPDERHEDLPHDMRTDAREGQPHRMTTSAREGAQYSDSDSNDYSDDYYDYDVDIDEDYDTDEEFTDDYDD